MPKRPNFLQTIWHLAPVVTITIAINFVVFLLWHIDEGSRLETFMIENFLVSTLHLEQGRIWTLLTSAYSHIELWHFAINMFVFWSFGVALEQLWPRRVFVGFYLIASVVGSACHCLATSYLLDDSGRSALGASGAVSGLLMAYALHYPHHKILLLGVIPIPALFGVLAFACIDVWGLIEQTHGSGVSIGHGAHLGGALAGALMWFCFLRKRFVPSESP